MSPFPCAEDGPAGPGDATGFPGCSLEKLVRAKARKCWMLLKNNRRGGTTKKKALEASGCPPSLAPRLGGVIRAVPGVGQALGASLSPFPSFPLPECCVWLRFGQPQAFWTGRREKNLHFDGVSTILKDGAIPGLRSWDGTVPSDVLPWLHPGRRWRPGRPVPRQAGLRPSYCFPFLLVFPDNPSLIK